MKAKAKYYTSNNYDCKQSASRSSQNGIFYGCLVVCTKDSERLKSTYLSAGSMLRWWAKLLQRVVYVSYCKESPLEAQV